MKERDNCIARNFERFIGRVSPHNTSATWRDLPSAATVQHCMEWLREQGWEATAVDPYIVIHLHPDEKEVKA